MELQAAQPHFGPGKIMKWVSLKNITRHMKEKNVIRICGLDIVISLSFNKVFITVSHIVWIGEQLDG